MRKKNLTTKINGVFIFYYTQTAKIWCPQKFPPLKYVTVPIPYTKMPPKIYLQESVPWRPYKYVFGCHVAKQQYAILKNK